MMFYVDLDITTWYQYIAFRVRNRGGGYPVNVRVTPVNPDGELDDSCAKILQSGAIVFMDSIESPLHQPIPQMSTREISMTDSVHGTAVHRGYLKNFNGKMVWLDTEKHTQYIIQVEYDHVSCMGKRRVGGYEFLRYIDGETYSVSVRTNGISIFGIPFVGRLAGIDIRRTTMHRTKTKAPVCVMERERSMDEYRMYNI